MRLYLLTLLISILGSLVQTVTGFGCGIVVMLFLPYLMPLLQASGLSTMICVLLNVFLVYSYRRHIQYKLVFWPAVISFAASTLAIRAALHVDLNNLKILFSLFLIALAVYFIFFSKRIQLKKNLPTAITCSGLSGAVNGLFGIGGPPMALYYLTVIDDKSQYIGTTQFYFLLTSIYTTILRITEGIITQDVLTALVPGVLGVLIGKMIGIWFVDRISKQKMEYIVYTFLAVSGFITLIGCL